MSEGLVGQATKEIPIINREGFYIVREEKDDEGAKATAALMKKNPNVLFVISRSCNENVVCYEAAVDKKHPNRLHSEKPVSIYWLNWEPKYAHAARKKKQAHDCDELSYPERKLAYGAKPKSTDKPGVFRLKMNVLPSLPIHIGIDPKTNRPRATLELHPSGQHPPGTKGGTLAFLERIYVHVIFNKLGIPNVPWLVYHGTTTDASHKPIQQKVIRKI
jgi:hypothetical protein